MAAFKGLCHYHLGCQSRQVILQSAAVTVSDVVEQSALAKLMLHILFTGKLLMSQVFLMGRKRRSKSVLLIAQE